MLSSSGSLSEHQPGQWLQNLQFHSPKDCGREFSRIGASSENQFIDAGMASTRSVHTVRKVTVVTSTSCHSTRGPHRDHCHPGQPYHAHNTLLIGQYGARIVTYSSVVKLWFTLRASARAVAPESPIPFSSRLWKTSTPELVQVVKIN